MSGKSRSISLRVSDGLFCLQELKDSGEEQLKYYREIIKLESEIECLILTLSIICEYLNLCNLFLNQLLSALDEVVSLLEKENKDIEERKEREARDHEFSIIKDSDVINVIDSSVAEGNDAIGAIDYSCFDHVDDGLPIVCMKDKTDGKKTETFLMFEQVRNVAFSELNAYLNRRMDRNSSQISLLKTLPETINVIFERFGFEFELKRQEVEKAILDKERAKKLLEEQYKASVLNVNVNNKELLKIADSFKKSSNPNVLLMANSFLTIRTGIIQRIEKVKENIRVQFSVTKLDSQVGKIDKYLEQLSLILRNLGFGSEIISSKPFRNLGEPYSLSVLDVIEFKNGIKDSKIYNIDARSDPIVLSFFPNFYHDFYLISPICFEKWYFSQVGILKKEKKEFIEKRNEFIKQKDVESLKAKETDDYIKNLDLAISGNVSSLNQLTKKLPGNDEGSVNSSNMKGVLKKRKI